MSQRFAVSKSVLVAAVLALGGMVGVWLALRSTGEKDAAEVAVGSAPVSTTSNAPDRAVTRRERYLLSYSFTSAQDGNPFVELSLTGQLELGDLVRSAEEHVVRAGLDVVAQLSQGAQESPAASLDKFTAELRRPFFGEFEPNGQLTTVRVEPGLERLTQTTLRGLLSAFQFVKPSPPPASGAAWEIEEQDSSGRYVARYEPQSTADGGPAAYTKRKLRYVESFGAGTTEVVSSLARFEYKGSTLERMELDEKVRVAPATKAAVQLGVLEGHLRVSLTWQGHDDRRVASDQYLSYERLGLRQVGTEQATERELDRAMAAGQSSDQVLAQLALPAETKEAKQARTRAYRALAAMVRQDPALVAQLEAKIRNRDGNTGTWISALRDAGTPEAQEALTRLLHEPSMTDDERVNLTRAVSLLLRPLAATTEVLRRLASDPELAEQAVYGIGSHVKRMAEQGLDVEPVLGELIQGYDDAKTPLEQDRYLTALGNAGHRDALVSIDDAIQGGSEGVKAEAVHALRRIEGTDVDERLVAQLSSPLPRVRREAARAIRDRPRSKILEEGLANALRREAHFLPMSALIQTCSLWAQGSSEIQESLAWVAENDPNENVRHQAASVLESSRK